jgi:hypothetical protein
MNSYFEPDSSDSLLFRIALTKIITVLGPFAKTILCWESQQITCADIYLFFLAIVTQLEEVFTKNTIKLQHDTIEAIRAITNKRSDELINKSLNDPYVMAFFLDPRKLTFYSWNHITHKKYQNTVMPQYTRISTLSPCHQFASVKLMESMPRLLHHLQIMQSSKEPVSVFREFSGMNMVTRIWIN